MLKVKRESDGLGQRVHVAKKAGRGRRGAGGKATGRGAVDAAPVGCAMGIGRVLLTDGRATVAEVVKLSVAGGDDCDDGPHAVCEGDTDRRVR